MEMSIPSTLSQAQDGAAAPRRGVLYRVRHHGVSSYLFGTIHVGKQNFYPLEPEVSRALAEARTLVLELDVRANDDFQLALGKYGSYPAGQSLRGHLSPAAMTRLQAALDRNGMPLASVDGFRPWLVANILVGMEMEKLGYQRSNGVEGFLLEAALRQQKPLRELETAEYQLSLFDGLSAAQQERYLLENLDDIDSGAALKKSAGLIDAWSAADRVRMAELSRELTTGDSVSARFMEQTLLGKRNPEMAANIESIMAREHSAFVGIGLLHLLGENSVPQLLKRRGYEVEQVY